MKLSFRWFGEKDIIPIEYIAQIPNMYSVVTAVYDVKPGNKWPREDLQRLKTIANKHHLAMEVIESIPVPEDIKLGKSNRDELIGNFIYNLRLCAEMGVKCVCYNFMPVFDWLRTTMHYQNSDGSNSLAYLYEDFKKVDPRNLHLPGWDESYSSEELQGLLAAYKNMTHDDLFNNLVYFLNRVIPVAEECDINLAIHPDDPPWDVFSLPRIISSEKDLDKLFKAVPSLRNGLTLCTGSFGAGRDNDIVHMCDKYSKEKRLHFLHMRNVKYLDENGSFVESGHLSKDGSLNMAEIVSVLIKNNFDGYVRPDHGRNIFGEDGKPGYGLYDRALGCCYINGLFEMCEYKESKK